MRGPIMVAKADYDAVAAALTKINSDYGELLYTSTKTQAERIAALEGALRKIAGTRETGLAGDEAWEYVKIARAALATDDGGVKS